MVFSIVQVLSENQNNTHFIKLSYLLNFVGHISKYLRLFTIFYFKYSVWCVFVTTIYQTNILHCKLLNTLD